MVFRCNVGRVQSDCSAGAFQSAKPCDSSLRSDLQELPMSINTCARYLVASAFALGTLLAVTGASAQPGPPGGPPLLGPGGPPPLGPNGLPPMGPGGPPPFGPGGPPPPAIGGPAPLGGPGLGPLSMFQDLVGEWNNVGGGGVGGYSILVRRNGDVLQQGAPMA